MRQLVKEKENSEFKPVKLRLKIDLVSYPARAEGLVNSITKNLIKHRSFAYAQLNNQTSTSNKSI